jgi:sulfide dehydrogenase cytochrome subunit
MKRISTGFLAIFLGVALAGAAVADVDAVAAGCAGCHGDNGVSQDAAIPTIAGLSEFYHADQLYFYRDGDRPCGQANADGQTMCTVAGDLSDDDIDAVAAHFAEMAFAPAKQQFDAELAAAGEIIHERDCGMCHSDGGSSADDDAGILAGQWAGYLEHTFASYRAGEREMPAPMKKKIDALSDDDVKALINFYASRQ